MNQAADFQVWCPENIYWCADEDEAYDCLRMAMAFGCPHRHVVKMRDPEDRRRWVMIYDEREVKTAQLAGRVAPVEHLRGLRRTGSL